MTTPTTNWQDNLAAPPIQGPGAPYRYPEDLPIPVNGLCYGSILFSLFERTNAALELLNDDHQVDDGHRESAYFLIRGLLKQGMTIAEQLEEKEEQTVAKTLEEV